MWSGKNILGVEQTGETGRVVVVDLSPVNQHETPDVSHGAWIMAKQYKQENEWLKEEIAILKAQCQAKDEAIAYFKEVLSAKDKQIVEIGEKLSEFQQGRQEKDIDFAKQLKTTDEELKKTKEIIFQAKETIVKKKAEMEKIPKEVQLFSANDCFDLQPSWFDTLLPSNIGCLAIDNKHPVRPNDRDANSTDRSSNEPLQPEHSKADEGKVCQLQQLSPPVFMPLKSAVSPPAEQNKPLPGEDVELAKEVTSYKANDCFDLQPSWFDTLLSSKMGCLGINNCPVRSNDLDAKNTDGSSNEPLQPEHSKADQGKVCQLQQLSPPVFMPVKSAVSPSAEQNKPLPGENVELAKEVTSYQANDCFDLQPSWFDTLLSSKKGCLGINNCPVRSNDLDAKNTDGSSNEPLQPEHSKADQGNVCQLQQLSPPVFIPVKSAVSPPAELNKPLPGDDVELAKEATSYKGKVCQLQQLSPPVSVPVMATNGYQLKNQLPPIPVANSNRVEVNKADIPVSGKDTADSKNTDHGTSSQPNPFRKVKSKVRQLQHPPAPLFVPVKAALTPPTGLNKPFLGEDVEPKAVDSAKATPENPYRRGAKGKARQLQYPPPALFVPVKAAAIIPPAGQNRQVLEKAAKAKAVDSIQTTPVNPYSKAAKGNGYIHHRPLPFVPVTTVLDGSKMANTYPANAFTQSVSPFPHIEQQGFLSRTFSKLFGF